MPTMGVMDSSNIVTEGLVQLALDIAVLSITRLMEVKLVEVVWGPKYLVIVVRHPALKEPIIRIIGFVVPWKAEWDNPDDYKKIANWKAETSQREGKPTSELTLMCPWDHQPGDYLYPGGVVEGKLAVGSSGLKGFADETASYIVLDTIEGLCKLKRDQLQKEKVDQLI